MSTTMATSAGRSGNSYTLGEQIAREAQEKLGAVAPDLALVFASSNHSYAELLRGIRSVTGDAPLIGCSTAGEFTESGHSHDGVVCALIHSDTQQWFIGLGKNIDKNLSETVQQALESVPVTQIPGYTYRTALVLIDGLLGIGEEVMNLLTQQLGPYAFTLAGGAAGDNGKLQQTHIFYNNEVHTNAMALCVIHSKQPMKVAAAHGHFPAGPTLTITKSIGARVYEIDGENAWKRWAHVTKERRELQGFSDEALKKEHQLSAFLVDFQLGILSESGTYKLRGLIHIYPNGSLKFASTIPEGVQGRFMLSDRESQLSSVQRAAKFAIAGSRKAVAGALIFDCTCRSSILQDEFYQSIQSFRNILGDVPLLGFETYGEMSMKAGKTGAFHNTTSVLLLIPE